MTKVVIQYYVFSPVKSHMKLSWLWNNVHSSSKSIFSEALEVRACYKGDLLDKIEDITNNFMVWKTYITNEIHEEAHGLSI